MAEYGFVFRSWITSLDPFNGMRPNSLDDSLILQLVAFSPFVCRSLASSLSLIVRHPFLLSLIVKFVLPSRRWARSLDSS